MKRKTKLSKSDGIRLRKAMKACKDIEENMKDPKFVRAVYEFIRKTSR